MEHRWTERMAADVRTLIYQDGVPIALGRTRNLSPQGAFIDLRGLDFPRARSLNIEFLTGLRLGGEPLRLAAMVVHSTAVGVGLMFLNLDAELAATIRALMNAAVAAPAAVDTTLPGYAAAASHGAARHARSPAYSRIGGKPGWRLAGRP